jgi:hypothetical protein
MTDVARLIRQPNVPSVPSVPAPPAFLEGDDDSEWGWSDWDGVDWQELRRQIKLAGG